MNKYIIIVCLLTLLVTSDDVKPADDACTCAKLMSENDCKAKSGCAWTAGTPASGTTAATQGSCATSTTPTTPTVATYCSSVTDPATKCASTTGCAYVDQKCTHFTGCTAYVKTTNADCQAISTLCITDGTQCTDAKSCNEYSTQTACEANPSISGIKKCKWDNGACRDYVCTEAASTLTTDTDCSAWLYGCVTTGKGCTQTLGACAAYTGDDVACGGLKGTDGICEGVANGTNCKARTCAGAAATLTADTDCAAYQNGCVTNGKGCVASPLPACASYPGDNTTCVGYIGSDGLCEGDPGATNCRARICTNAPSSNNTDALCAAYRVGCVTTGKGCASTQVACASFSGTNTTCIGYIGTEGYCKGNNATTPSPCVKKECSDAPATTNTNTACEAYQIGCKTTGKGCVSSLQACSSYKGTTTTCEGYIGSDGKCKGTDATNPDAACAPKVCTDAPASITTNEACAQFQTGCVTNGAGCVNQTSCINTIKQVSCTGTSSCGWNSICVASAHCSDFLTASICLGNNAGSKPCYWTGSVCRDLACSDAPTTHNTDALCNTFLAGCVTKGDGCLSPTDGCNLYKGDQAKCASFTRKCWNTSTAPLTAPCAERTCGDNITSTSDSACDIFKSGCRTKGTGCIDPSSPCSAYFGTRTKCDAFSGNNGSIRCYNTLAAIDTTACTVKACIDNSTAATDTECDAFLKDCVSTGAGCISKSVTCASYSGTQATCANFKGTNGTKPCWNATAATATTSCKEKECSDAPTSLATDTDCGNFLSGCLTSGSGCKSPTDSCSQYQGTLTKCSTFTGNSKLCYKTDSCADRLCSDKAIAADNTECTNYLSTCRFFKTGCVNAGSCTSYLGISLTECQDVYDNTTPTALKCWWQTGGTNCIPRSCATAPESVASQADCDNHFAGCLYNGKNKCYAKSTCGNYVAAGDDDPARTINCKNLTDTSGKSCLFITGATNCTDRTCGNVQGTISGQTDCDNHKTGCQFNGTACVDTGACNTYNVTGDDAAKLSKCKVMKNTSSQTCFFVTGAAQCTEPTCANAVAPANQTGCDTHLSGKCSFKYACVNRTCQGATSKSSTTDCGTWLINCQWDGKSTSSCVDQAAACPTIFPTATTVDADKTKFCENYILTGGTKPGCQLNTAKNACEARTCVGYNLTSATSTTDCGNWLANCQWDGKPSASKCVAQTSACPDAAALTAAGPSADADKTKFCENFILTGGTKPGCQLNTAKNACEARTCVGYNLTSATSTTDCGNWLANCQWDGKPSASKCVAQTSACPDAAALTAAGPTADADKTKFCENFILTGGTKPGCQLNTAKNACEARTCVGYNLTSATSTTDCGNWLANCQWDGKPSASKCVAQTSACPDAAALTAAGPTADADKTKFCENFILTGGTKPGCQLNTAKNACEARTCVGYNLTSATSTTDCGNWLANCQWDGKPSASKCVAQTSACPDAAALTAAGPTADADKTKFCENFILTGGTKPGCQLNTAKDACEARTCVGYNLTSATSTTDCGNWLANCQWDGKPSASKCVAQTSACPDAAALTAAGPSADADKTKFCENFILTGGTKPGCQLNTAKDACEARTCVGYNLTSATSTTDCGNWLANCQWDGKPSASKCVAQTSACPDAAALTAAGPSADADKTKFCENFILTGGTKPGCQLNTAKNACEARTCVGYNLTSATSTTDCGNWLANCQWDGKPSASKCVAQTSACPDAAALTAAGPTADADKTKFCENFILTGGTKPGCQLNTAKNACEARTCAGATSKTSKTDCDNWKTDCQWDGSTSCVDSTATCPQSYVTATHTSDTIKTNYCQNFVTTGTTKCQVGTLGTGCETKTCANAVPSASATDCSNWLSSCVYTGSGCVDKQTSCASYTLTGTDNTVKRNICTALKDTAGKDCVFVNGASTCAEKACSNVYSDTSITKEICENWLGTTCRFVNSTCQNAVACTSLTIPLTLTSDSDKKSFCSGIKDDNSNLCIFISGTTCATRTCGNIPTTPAQDTDCSTHLSTCTISKPATAACVAKSGGCNTFTGTAADCKTFKGVNGTIPCWSISASSTPAACIDKACNHNSTATSDVECNEFLAGCKTNGAGCVAPSTACSTFDGNATTCVLRKASDNKNYCKLGSEASGDCKDKSCYDDGSSTTDDQCKSFMSTCLTNGAGCIPKTEPCTSYRGTQTTCAAFTGSSGANKCWNTTAATATTACVNKKCSDDTTSTSDAACGVSLPNCVTKGTGCIEKTAACNAYTGNQTTCSKFKGNSGTVLCWNIDPTASSACVDKACTHNSTATTDSDCDTFLPSGTSTPKCVTNGAGCVSFPRNCSGFTGTTEQCGKFKASDGPCKSTVTTGSGPCTPRVCTEALNTNNTEALCQAYHPNCHTTGYGCVTSVSCSNVTDQNACTAKSGCSWVNNCRSIGTDCASLTASGASICVNTPVTTGTKKCAWYNNACRAVTCQDLSEGLKTDDACKAQLSTCTTRGEGCITKGACSTYSTETICKAAKTTDNGDTCTWDGTACRAKRCTDATTGTTTDDGCNTFLTGCKTNGVSCISAGFNCTSLITNAACQKDGSNKPCLWVNSVCYNYVKCEDINMTTHTACQAFSPLCTTDGTKCIAISSCSKTSLQVSCIKGTDGTCGWLPAAGANAGKCQKFGACSDAVSTDKATCQAYGSACITDGTKCIDQGTCSTYTTQIACDTGGTDGICTFSSSACRLRECTDATASNATSITLHSGCYSFAAKTKCTTNGTSCIALATCSSYTVEAGCELGTDGICTWAVPVGNTTSTIKTCRLKVCQDFTLTTSAACSTALAGTGCVSNGTNCIAKSTCSTYTNKEACNGGGTDGLCAFTAASTTTPTVGTCKLMTACSDANNDSVACAAKSAVCNWKVTTSGATTTSACNAHDCTTKAVGTDCNPVPSFDSKTYSICIPSQPSGCVLGAGTSLTSTSCYGDSLGTYTWNAQSNQCTACFTRTPDNPNPNPGGNTGSTYGTLLNTLAILLVLATMVA